MKIFSPMSKSNIYSSRTGRHETSAAQEVMENDREARRDLIRVTAAVVVVVATIHALPQLPVPHRRLQAQPPTPSHRPITQPSTANTIPSRAIRTRRTVATQRE